MSSIKRIDRIRALAVRLDRPPSPGYIVSLREALGFTQREFGERIGVDSVTVSRWERETVRPGPTSLAAMEKLRTAAVRKGQVIEG